MAAPRKRKDSLTGLSPMEASATGLLSLDDINSFKLSLKKEFGNNAGIDEDDFITSFIPTEIEALDYYLGGGLPVGKITEVAGKEGTGKSSFGIHMLGRVQKKGGLCCHIDTEGGGAGDKFRFEHFGVDPKRCILTEEDKAEKVFAQVERIANFIVQKQITVPSLVVIDSIAGLTTAQELEAALDAAQYPATAKMISKGIKRVKALCRESNLTVLCINQSRIKMGGMVNPYTGPEMTTPGGDALKFAAITRLFMERGLTLQDKVKKNPYGHVVKTKVLKCKTAASLNRVLPMAFFYDKRGYYNPKIVYDLLCDTKYLGDGAWKSITMPDGSEKRFQGENAFFELYESSEENKAHFISLMKNAFNETLAFGAADEQDSEELLEPLLESVEETEE